MKGAAQVCYWRPWRGDALSLTPALFRWERAGVRENGSEYSNPCASKQKAPP